MAIAFDQPYAKIPLDVILSLKPMAGHLLAVIAASINPENNELERSLRDLADDANMSTVTLLKYIDQLEDAGHIRVARKGGGKYDDVNVYSLAGEMERWM